MHSPFAFNFITKVVNSKHWYYAFDDINHVLMRHNIEIYDYKYHHITYRLIQYFKPTSVLEIGSANNINLMYISHSSDDISCHSYMTRKEDVTLAKNLLQDIGREAVFIDNLSLKTKYDAIFIDITSEDVDLDKIFENSADKCFWFIHGINTPKGKLFWKKIKNNKRVDITFDKRNAGIAILNKSYNKQNYFI